MREDFLFGSQREREGGPGTRHLGVAKAMKAVSAADEKRMRSIPAKIEHTANRVESSSASFRAVCSTFPEPPRSLPCDDTRGCRDLELLYIELLHSLVHDTGSLGDLIGTCTDPSTEAPRTGFPLHHLAHHTLEGGIRALDGGDVQCLVPFLQCSSLPLETIPYELYSYLPDSVTPYHTGLFCWDNCVVCFSEGLLLSDYTFSPVPGRNLET